MGKGKDFLKIEEEEAQFALTKKFCEANIYKNFDICKQ